MRIVVDVMGGDRPPGELIRGAVAASDRHGFDLALVGPPDPLRAALADASLHENERLRILPASQVIGMEERPVQAVRAKRDASLLVGLAAVRDGDAQAFVSPGNTGAIVAGSLFTLGRLKAIPRPGLAAILPTTEGAEFVLIDVGATVDSTPEQLLHFGLMGATFAQSVLGIDDPLVALLSNGSERGKGNRTVLRAAELLERAPFRFLGNVEGHHLLTDRPADVVVSDGFVGNVLLKGIEGGVTATTASLRVAIRSALRCQLGAALMRPAFRQLRQALGYQRRGGAPLLGVQGTVVIAHGRSDAEAIAGAIDIARRAVTGRVVQQLATGLDGWRADGR
jgi:glycerol-3-phosphate acyltransferase PlsX